MALLVCSNAERLDDQSLLKLTTAANYFSVYIPYGELKGKVSIMVTHTERKTIAVNKVRR